MLTKLTKGDERQKRLRNTVLETEHCEKKTDQKVLEKVYIMVNVRGLKHKSTLIATLK